MHELIKAKVDALELLNGSNEQLNTRAKDQSTNLLIRYMIKKDQPSTILSDYQLSNLAAQMQA